MKEIILTREGVERLERELEQLTTTGRQELAERLRDALAAGADPAENEEYNAAKEEQMRLEQRIAQLEERLASARIVEAADVPEDTVAIGSKVRLKDLETQKALEYEIVGSGEGNPAEGRVSSESPVGSALLGRHKGDVVDVETPRGVWQLKLLRVHPAGAGEPTRRRKRAQTGRARKPTPRRRSARA